MMWLRFGLVVGLVVEEAQARRMGRWRVVDVERRVEKRVCCASDGVVSWVKDEDV